MARVNPEVERLQRHVAILSKTLDRLHANPPDIPFTACDNSCVCAKAEGMAPNGGCRCDERKLRKAVQYWRLVATHRLAVIDLHRRLGCSDPDDEDDEAVPSPSNPGEKP